MAGLLHLGVTGDSEETVSVELKRILKNGIIVIACAPAPLPVQIKHWVYTINMDRG